MNPVIDSVYSRHKLSTRQGAIIGMEFLFFCFFLKSNSDPCYFFGKKTADVLLYSINLLSLIFLAFTKCTAEAKKIDVPTSLVQRKDKEDRYELVYLT